MANFSVPKIRAAAIVSSELYSRRTYPWVLLSPAPKLCEHPVFSWDLHTGCLSRRALSRPLEGMQSPQRGLQWQLRAPVHLAVTMGLWEPHGGQKLQARELLQCSPDSRNTQGRAMNNSPRHCDSQRQGKAHCSMNQPTLKPMPKPGLRTDTLQVLFLLWQEPTGTPAGVCSAGIWSQGRWFHCRQMASPC